MTTKKPTVLTAQHYDITVSVQLDHSDMTLHEVFDMFKTLCIGMGFAESTYEQVLLDKALEIEKQLI